MTDDLVPMKCPAETLDSLAVNFSAFGPSGGAPDWLLTGVWLDCGRVTYLATPSIEILKDGFVARPLVIERPESVRAGIEDALPDIQGRLHARGSHVVLPDELDSPESPDALRPWPPGGYRMTILLRVAESAVLKHRIACALLFSSESQRLLVGTDRTTLAMVMSDDDELVDHYLGECEQVSAPEYRTLIAG